MHVFSLHPHVSLTLSDSMCVFTKADLYFYVSNIWAGEKCFFRNKVAFSFHYYFPQLPMLYSSALFTLLSCLCSFHQSFLFYSVAYVLLIRAFYSTLLKRSQGRPCAILSSLLCKLISLCGTSLLVVASHIPMYCVRATALNCAKSRLL